MQLRYNPANGVWMPAPEARPRQRRFAQPEPLTRNQPVFKSVPLMPAYPRRPRQRMSAPPGYIRGPQYGKIPNRPVIHQPRIPRVPANIREKSKWGQYALTNTVPEPTILPKPNLPNMTRYNAVNMRQQQMRMEEQMRRRGGGMPDTPKYARRMIRARRVKPTDLGLNATRGSNSQLLNFGSYLGRTVGSPL